jgi:putative transcriptional regulator
VLTRPAAALIQGFALEELLHTMLAPTSFYNLITMPFHALLPVPALAGAALLTFAHHPGRRGRGRRDQGHDLTRRRTDAGPGGSEEKAGEDKAAAIRLHLDELLGRRGMTIVNLSILKNGRAQAIRFNTLWPGCARRWDVSPVSC